MAKKTIKPPKIEKQVVAPKPKSLKPSKDKYGRTVFPGYAWVKVADKEESLKLQQEHKMAGFDPKRMEALVKGGK